MSKRNFNAKTNTPLDRVIRQHGGATRIRCTGEKLESGKPVFEISSMINHYPKHIVKACKAHQDEKYSEKLLGVFKMVEIEVSGNEN